MTEKKRLGLSGYSEPVIVSTYNGVLFLMTYAELKQYLTELLLAGSDDKVYPRGVRQEQRVLCVSHPGGFNAKPWDDNMIREFLNILKEVTL